MRKNGVFLDQELTDSRLRDFAADGRLLRLSLGPWVFSDCFLSKNVTAEWMKGFAIKFKQLKLIQTWVILFSLQIYSSRFDTVLVVANIPIGVEPNEKSFIIFYFDDVALICFNAEGPQSKLVSVSLSSWCLFT